MAVVCPFRGVRYNRELVPDLSRVVTQPYDRIGPVLRERYYDSDPNNYVRLILNRPAETDTHPAESSPYTRARDLYTRWMAEGILKQDAAPSLYVYHQTFPPPDGTTRPARTRKAFIALLELSRFGEGIVLPHERTLSGPKVDRLNLFRATGVNFEPVFLLYPDPDGENRINRILDAAIAGRAPWADVHELLEQDVHQEMWPVSDPGVVAAVTDLMAPMRNLIIADGHHRYETALNYRDLRREEAVAAGLAPARQGAPPEAAAYDYVLCAFVSLSDPGLAILPTHRLVHDFVRLTTTQVLDAATPYFEIVEFDSRSALEEALRSSPPGQHAFGFLAGSSSGRREASPYMWVLRDSSVMDRLASGHIPAWRELDVSILHELVLEKLLGLSKESIVRKENLEYLRDPAAGFDAIDRGEAQFLFLLNPTRMDQVAACAQAGEPMPQKSTDFYPKMVSGLVLYPLEA